METTQENEAQEPRYKEALNELEQILDQIEGGEVDLDDLGAKVERAAALIQLCRGKIERAEVQVRRIIESLDREAGA
jgi:exodeoxyribonuclease VII small subunit